MTGDSVVAIAALFIAILLAFLYLAARKRVQVVQSERIATFEKLCGRTVTVYVGVRFLDGITGRVVGVGPDEDMLVLDTISGRRTVLLSSVVAVDDVFGHALAVW